MPGILCRCLNQKNNPGRVSGRYPRTTLPLALASLLVTAGALTSNGAESVSREVSIIKNLDYKSGANLGEYEKERCKLDLYLPRGKTEFPTLLWFHGGALQTGSKDDAFNARIGQSLAEAGIAVAMANYRLSPKAKYPAYIEDAAAAFAWVRAHIAAHGGNPRKIFVGGHSAGGYLTFMVGLDSHYLRQQGLETTAIAGLVPISGQTMTHYTVREERGLNKETIIADEAAPVHYLRKDAPPMLVLFAEHDMPARVEENQYLVAALKAKGDPRVLEQMIAGRDHGSIAGNIPKAGDPAAKAIIDFIDSCAPAPN
jgi:acetyl esterase/lipase